MIYHDLGSLANSPNENTHSSNREKIPYQFNNIALLLLIMFLLNYDIKFQNLPLAEKPSSIIEIHVKLYFIYL